jgi:hypothetical protein
MTLTKETKVVHFAPTEKRVRQRDPMCGFAPEEDAISTDPEAVNCQDCADWIKAPSENAT